MNILDAVQSGKPFKRSAWLNYLTNDTVFTLAATDVLATDYEIQEPKVTLTRSQLAAQWDALSPVAVAASPSITDPNAPAPPTPLTAATDPDFEKLAKGLGL